jgi:hypothetical protein
MLHAVYSMKRISIALIVSLSGLFFSCSYGPVPTGTLVFKTKTASTLTVGLPTSVTLEYAIQDYSIGHDYRIALYKKINNPHFGNFSYDDWYEPYLYGYVEHTKLPLGVESDPAFVYTFTPTSSMLSGAVYPYDIIFVLIYTDVDDYSYIITRTDPITYTH